MYIQMKKNANKNTLPTRVGAKCGGDIGGDDNRVERLIGGCQRLNSDAKVISLAGNQLLKSSVTLHNLISMKSESMTPLK